MWVSLRHQSQHHFYSLATRSYYFRLESMATFYQTHAENTELYITCHYMTTIPYRHQVSAMLMSGWARFPFMLTLRKKQERIIFGLPKYVLIILNLNSMTETYFVFMK